MCGFESVSGWVAAIGFSGYLGDLRLVTGFLWFWVG